MSPAHAVPICIIDADRSSSTALKSCLELSGFTAVKNFESITSWWAAAESKAGIMIINDNPAKVNLRDAINLVKELCPDMYVLLLASNPNPARVIAGLNAGAFEYLTLSDDICLKVEATTREIEATVRILETVPEHFYGRTSDDSDTPNF